MTEQSGDTPCSWAPRVLSEYEIGHGVSAIEAVLRSDKPLAEVGCRRANLADLEADLQGCLDLVSESGDVKFWTRPYGPRFRYGFYREPWALHALDFIDRGELDPLERAWISGLLFGYRPRAIQQYIDRQNDGGSVPRGTILAP